MMILLLIFSALLKAEDLSTEKYCFPSLTQMESAKRSFQSIQVPSDEIRVDDKCLTIMMKPHRFELIHKYMTSSFPNASISFSTENIKREPCNLKVEKIKTKSGQDLNATTDQGVNLELTESSSTASEVGQIQTLKEFELIYDQNQIKGTCRYINSDRYEISLEVRKNPSVTLLKSSSPPDQETMILTTQVQLNRGEKIEIGSVIRDSKNKKQSVDIGQSAEINKGEQASNEKVFLSIQ